MCRYDFETVFINFLVCALISRKTNLTIYEDIDFLWLQYCGTFSRRPVFRKKRCFGFEYDTLNCNWQQGSTLQHKEPHHKVCLMITLWKGVDSDSLFDKIATYQDFNACMIFCNIDLSYRNKLVHFVCFCYRCNGHATANNFFLVNLLRIT